MSGERGEQELQAGDTTTTAAALLVSMPRMTSGVGLELEPDWENPPLVASPYGTDLTQASIGFASGHSAGSASPLTWAQAQLARLALALGAGRPLEQPAISLARYVEAPPPATASIRANPDGIFTLSIQEHSTTDLVTVTASIGNATGYLTLCHESNRNPPDKSDLFQPLGRVFPAFLTGPLDFADTRS